jgi:hypothetical protein
MKVAVEYGITGTYSACFGALNKRFGLSVMNKVICRAPGRGALSQWADAVQEEGERPEGPGNVNKKFRTGMRSRSLGRSGPI